MARGGDRSASTGTISSAANWVPWRFVHYQFGRDARDRRRAGDGASDEAVDIEDDVVVYNVDVGDWLGRFLPVRLERECDGVGATVRLERECDGVGADGRLD